jgi:hypothetical protein
LGATEIQELIWLNVTWYSQTKRAELALNLCDQLKKLPRDGPIAIPDPATYINKASLMAMEHDTRLDVLNKLILDSLWGTPKHRELLMEMGIDSVHITKRNSIQIQFTLQHFKGTSDKTALLDTGAMESFINHESVICLKLGTQKLPIIRPIYNVDRTQNQHGNITHICHLLVTKGNKKETVPFYITDLGKDRFIFGYPWCQDFKPDIDWENSVLKGPKVKVETLLHGKYQHVKEYLASARKAQENQDDVIIKVADIQETPESILQELEESHHEEISRLEWSGVTTPFKECGRVLI